MSSSKKCSIPGFKIDPETGKYIAVPVKEFSFRFQDSIIEGEDSSKKPNMKRSNSLANKDVTDKFKTNKTDFSKKCTLPGFEIDPETGKYVAVPISFASTLQEDSSKNPSLQQNNSLATKDKEVVQPVKFRKIDAGVRKELFALPVRSSQKAKETEHNPKKKLNAVRKSLVKSFPSKSATPRGGPKRKESEPVSDSPQPLNGETNNKDNTLVSSDSSVSEFIQFEELCKTPKVVLTNASPVSSVCTLLDENLLINSNKKARKENDENYLVNVVQELKTLVKNSAELHEKTTDKIKEVLELQRKSEENLRLMTALIDQIEVSQPMEIENKENTSKKRQSLRLQNKIASNEEKAFIPTTSPVILKAGDLRKSALTKSLVNKCQKYQISSPRIQNAMNMYNSLVSNCGVLQTPKPTRSKLAESPQASNLRKSINSKVMEQCVMLQYTPAHKKKPKS